MTSDLITIHAQKRMQQRSIPLFVVELLEQFGSAIRCGGAERLILDRQARARLEPHFGHKLALGTLGRWRKVYAVIGDNGRLVTVAHRKGRFRRP